MATKHRIHRARRTTSRRSRLLWDKLVDLGFERFTIEWVPMGPALEMCGHSGGYVMVELPGCEVTPLGLSLDEALRNAVGHAAYVRAFDPERLAASDSSMPRDAMGIISGADDGGRAP